MWYVVHTSLKSMAAKEHMRSVLETAARLPESFSSSEIRLMIKELQADIAILDTRPSPPTVEQKELILHKKHSTLAISYPLLFHRSIRGAIDESMLDQLLTLKALKDAGGVNEERARELVVDGAREAIEMGRGRRVMRPEPGQSTTLSLRYDEKTQKLVEKK